jgi:DNA polymerase-3 subunit epsilon
MLLIVDIETNGKDSIVEIGAYKIDPITMAIDSQFHRYYYPKNKEYNWHAVAKTGLYPKVLYENINKQVADHNKSGNKNKYPYYFESDKEWQIFVNNVTGVVAHNISYEDRFLTLPTSNYLCTMKANKKDVSATDKNGSLKNPNLKETTIHYGIKFDDDSYHSAMYDVTVTLEILKSMKKNNHHSLSDFLTKAIRSNQTKQISLFEEENGKYDKREETITDNDIGR